METEIVSETKYRKTRSAQIKTSVFATSNNINKLSDPLKSRFFIVKLEPYNCEQFLEITNELLSHHKVDFLVLHYLLRIPQIFLKEKNLSKRLPSLQILGTL